MLAAAAVQYLRPLPAVASSAVLAGPLIVGKAPVIPWPAQGEAALSVEGLGDIGSSGGTTALPMASTAKIMTALLTLETHPLAPGQAGPVLTVTRGDVANFYAERNQNESVVPVAIGEQLAEYQLLEGLLLPSGSNFADMLASWDSGSVPAFVASMNQRALALGMASTHFADASGFSPATVSTPSDLVKLARVAMAQPVLAAVVAEKQAALPVAGVVNNLDTLLGQNGIIGIKTGHTDQAGGCFLMAADLKPDGQPVRVYGALLGQPNQLPGAFAATTALITALTPALHLRPVAARGDVVGRYETPWGESGTIVTGSGVSWVLLDGMTVTRQMTLTALPAKLPAGSRAGTLALAAPGHQVVIPLLTSTPINGPDLGWRLTRGF
ncbi:MAG: D-alanyl-D-alanine carboxypeptidase [Candidatus Dormibacteraeota bacterium]|nr:D-alanyl-D-alanine carboxypeptidase [Candidatus Dormibacteraeota bacterium]